MCGLRYLKKGPPEPNGEQVDFNQSGGYHRSGGPRRYDDRRRPRRGDSEFGPLEVTVVEGNLEGAIRVLKRKLTREGVLKQLKLKRFYEKPSVRAKRKRKEAERRRRRQVRRLAKRAAVAKKKGRTSGGRGGSR